MNLDNKKDIKIASIAKVRETIKDSTEQISEEKELEEAEAGTENVNSEE